MDREQGTIKNINENKETKINKLTYKIFGASDIKDKLERIFNRLIVGGCGKILPADLNLLIIACDHNGQIQGQRLGSRKFLYTMGKKGKEETDKDKTNEKYKVALAINTEYYRFTNKLDLNTMLLIIIAEALGEISQAIYTRDIDDNISIDTLYGLRKYLETVIYSYYDRELAKNLTLLNGTDDLLHNLNENNWKLKLITLLSSKIALLDETHIPDNDMSVITYTSFLLEKDLREIYSSILGGRYLDRGRYNSYLLRVSIMDYCKDNGG